MNPLEAERLLTLYGGRNGRNRLIRDALTAGLTKNRIHTLTGIARTTIDRIVKEQSMAYPTGITLPGNVTIGRPEGMPDYWAIFTDGRRFGSDIYSKREDAERMALRSAELDAVNAVIEQVIGRMKAYTREQYETVCAALGLEPAPDDEIGNYADLFGDFWMSHYSARDIIVYDLRRRRMAGIKQEKADVQVRRRQELEEAGLAGPGALDRPGYERACQIMGVPVLTDQQCVATSDAEMAKISGGILVVDPGMPRDTDSIDLAERRTTSMEQQAAQQGRHCDECGTPIIGSAMTASLGLACSVECYDAMADRPGRYASR